VIVDVALGQPYAPAGIPIYRPCGRSFTSGGARDTEAAKARHAAAEARRGAHLARVRAEREAEEAPRLRAEAEQRRIEATRQERTDRARFLAEKAAAGRRHRAYWSTFTTLFLLAAVVAFPVMESCGTPTAGCLAAAGALAGPGAYCAYTATRRDSWFPTWEWVFILVEFGALGAAAGFGVSRLL
jgi:hypothetical protein